MPETYLYVPGGNVKFNNYVAFAGRIVAGTQSNFNQLQGIAIGTSSALMDTPFKTILAAADGGTTGTASTDYDWTGNVVYGGS